LQRGQDVQSQEAKASLAVPHSPVPLRALGPPPSQRSTTATVPFSPEQPLEGVCRCRMSLGDGRCGETPGGKGRGGAWDVASQAATTACLWYKSAPNHHLSPVVQAVGEVCQRSMVAPAPWCMPISGHARVPFPSHSRGNGGVSLVPRRIGRVGPCFPRDTPATPAPSCGSKQ